MDSVDLTLVDQEVCANCSSHTLKCSVTLCVTMCNKLLPDNATFMRDNASVTFMRFFYVLQSCHSDIAPTRVCVYSECLYVTPLCFNDIFSFLLVGGAGGYSSGGFPGGFQFTFG